MTPNKALKRIGHKAGKADGTLVQGKADGTLVQKLLDSSECFSRLRDIQKESLT